MASEVELMGKGDKRRPSQISRAEYDLKWALAYGWIAFAEYERKLKALRKRESRR